MAGQCFCAKIVVRSKSDNAHLGEYDLKIATDGSSQWTLGIRAIAPGMSWSLPSSQESFACQFSAADSAFELIQSRHPGGVLPKRSIGLFTDQSPFLRADRLE